MYGAAEIKRRYGFCLGDRVVFTASTDPDSGVKYGQQGTVCSLDDDYGVNNVGVRWDERNIRYHNCSGKCTDYYGWWVPANEIEKVDIDIGEFEASEVSIADFLSIE